MSWKQSNANTRPKSITDITQNAHENATGNAEWLQTFHNNVRIVFTNTRSTLSAMYYNAHGDKDA